jgi:hypothetical protein
MSNRKAVAEVYGPLKLARPHGGHLAYGVLLPATVIAIELSSRLCATSFFDPMPTWWHAGLVALVPVANLLLYLALSEQRARARPTLLALNGAALAVGAFYSLIFLPLLPLALVAVLVGIGVLPFAPLGGLVAAWQLNRLLRARAHPLIDGKQWRGRPMLPLAFWGGLGAGIVALVGLDARVAVTRYGAELAQSADAQTRARGLWWLRTFGDQDQLLRDCYDSNGRPQGLATAAMMLFDGRRGHGLSPMAARETYYRVTGRPFNAVPAPYAGTRRTFFNDFAWDRDQGGSEVAGRVPGLSLAASRIDGTISGDDAVAYLEWTLEFRNASALMREARAQIALPPGGVVSRATLWVNGEEREAAFASREAARKAYENVVRRMQDPLLVTTRGGDRVLAQAFPIPPNGGTIKIRLGITAPVELSSTRAGGVVLPAIVDRNFTIGDSAPHAVWIESRQALSLSGGPLAADSMPGGSYRVSGSLSDAALSGRRMKIEVARDPAATTRLARLGDNASIRQEVRPSVAGKPNALMILVDASLRMSGHVEGLISALDKIPQGLPTGVVIGSDQPVTVPIAPWNASHKAEAIRVLRATRFVGGADNTDGIVTALKDLERITEGQILWVHAPQPVAFAASQPRLEQATARLSRLAPVMLYEVEAGPNQLLNDAPWSWSARTLPRLSDVEGDVGRYFELSLGDGARPEIVRTELIEPKTDLPRGSDHIARLWAKDTILVEALRKPSGDRSEVVKLAAAYQLVTPVSGAVVLETARQYQEAGLKPVASGTVPTVPEPHEWALLLIALLSLTWIARQRMRVENQR